MSAIAEGGIFTPKKSDRRLHGCYRILKVLSDPDRVIFIQIPMGPRKRKGARQANYYARGFRVERLSDMENWMADGLIVESSAPACPPRWSWTDAQLVDACPPNKRILITKNNRETWTTSAIIKRDKKWELIRPLVEMAITGVVPDVSYLDAKAVERAKECGVSLGQVLDALHRYYGGGLIKNALLPNTQNCGAPNKSRYGKKGVRLGRPNAAAAAGNTELAGRISDEHDRQNLQDGYAMYVRPGTTVHEAFIATSATFYSAKIVQKHGMLVPLLLPANQRPTEREFATHGPEGGDRHGAARRQMGEGEWAKNYRSLIGSARSGIPAIGQVSSIDASPIDVNLTAIFDRLCPVGVGRGLFVREAWLGLFLGWRIVIGGLGADDAKLAILRAATEKSQLLKRLDLEDLPPEDFVALFSSRYLSDNGELRCTAGIESCVDQLTSSIEFVMRGRADLNSISEGGHHSRHRRFDHYLAGSTRGRPAKRGEPLAITKALLNAYEYERLLTLWVHWANTKQRVPHLVPSEMRKSMQGQRFDPTRIAIYRWAKNMGYVAGKPVDSLLLRTHLLPSFTASVRRNGLFLHRPGTGDAVELLKDAHFNDRYLEAVGLYQSFGRYDKPQIIVKGDPDDLSEILLVDANGTHVIPNASNDVIYIREACIADLCAKNDLNKRENVESRTECDQNDSDQRAFRQATEAPAKAEKAAAIAERGKVSARGRNRSSVRANQAKNNADQLTQAATRSRSQTESDSVATAIPTINRPPLSVVPAPTSPGSAINHARLARLANFHKNRNP